MMRLFFFLHALCLVLVSSLLQAQASPTLTAVEHGDEMVLELGPIDIPARSGHGVIGFPSQRVVVPVGGWMHGYSVELVDRNGTRVSQHLLHHLYVMSPQKRELFTPEPLYIAAASGETDPLTLPRLIGYQMKKGDTLVVEAGFNDPAGKEWNGIRLRVRFPRTGVSSLIGAVAIYPFYLSVPAPQRPDTAFIPPGRSESYWEGHPAVPGRILGLSGHAPAHGVELVLEDRTTHKVIWDAHPELNPAGEALPIPVKQFVGLLQWGVPIWPDHVYRLTVTYNNPTTAPIPASGGWGVLGGVFKPETGAVWPVVK